MTYQAYDASGNRFLKVGLERNLTQQNASTTLAYDQKTITLYISQDMTAQRNRYHKHIFAGSERIATKPCGEPSRTKGGGIPPAFVPPNDQDTLSPQMPPEIPPATQSTTAPLAATDSTWDNFLHQTASCLGVQRQNLTLDFTLVSLQEKVPTTETQVYYYHTDHLGSTGFLSATLSTTGGARLVQHYQYLPFGENFIHQKGTSHSYHNPYEFNGKEKDLETGYNYYGARHYNAAWGVWLSVDPLAHEREWLSPYNFCSNNPILRIDPDGALDDDYFNKKGEYLGSDEAKTDNVKIIDQKDWDANKTLNPDGSESITHATGSTISTDHSKSNLTEEATLNVYDHYNPTGLDLKAKQNETGAGGLTFHAERKSGKTSEWIYVKIEGNKRTKVADHANEITNSFIHEGKHYSDYKTLGFDGFVNVPKNRKEQRAVSTQMKHDSFKGTRPGFQQAIKRYGQKHGMIFPIKPKPAILIPINK